MRVLHLGKFFSPVPGGIETFMRDVMVFHAAHGIVSGAVVHADTSGKEQIGSLSLWQAACHGNLLYAPISPGFAYWLNRAIDEFKPDVLHLHLPNTSAFWALLLPAARRIPWVVHWHADVITPLSIPALRLAYLAYRPFERAVLRRAKTVIATSPHYLDSSTPLALWRNKCRVIPLGLASSPPAPSPAAQTIANQAWLPGKRRLLAVGRLSHYKGFRHLIDAATKLPDVHAIIVGDGEERSALEAQISDLKIGTQVSLAGRLSDDDLSALLASCEVFCLPSVERTEAFGMVLLEAMRMGKPVVACNIPGSGVNWVVEDGKSGYLAHPQDPEDLARMIEKALQHPELGYAGQQRLRQKFAIEVVAQEIANLYAMLLVPTA